MHVNFKPNAANHPQVNTIFRDSNHAQVGWLFMATRVYHLNLSFEDPHRKPTRSQETIAPLFILLVADTGAGPIPCLAILGDRQRELSAGFP